MKKRGWMAGLVPVLLLAGAPQAKALNAEWAVALGALGGYVLSENFGSGRTATRECVEPQYITLNDAYGERHYPSSYFSSTPRSSHYEYVERRIWVPGRYEYVQTGHNRYRRSWIEGYYRTEVLRVLVQD